MNIDLNNLAVTATGHAMSKLMGTLYDTLQSKIANGGRDTKCKFYYAGNDGSGSIISVVTKNIVGGVVTDLRNEVVNQFNSLLNPNKKTDGQGSAWIQPELDKQEDELSRYGKMEVDGGTVLALDDWGCVSVDALMLGIELDKTITVTQNYPEYGYELKGGVYKEKTPVSKHNGPFSTNTLVWYDTTALITINSDKNLIVTPVQGRDYSRKELVSNGDINFSVSGHITSGRPDIYPTEEVQKFIQVMRYKGVVRVNNQILDQFGIERIIIKDFNLTPREGAKAIQDYTFNAIGLQPRKELEASDDTVNIITLPAVNADGSEDSEWASMFKSQLEGLKSMAFDLGTQGLGLATGLLDQKLDEAL